MDAGFPVPENWPCGMGCAHAPLLNFWGFSVKVVRHRLTFFAVEKYRERDPADSLLKSLWLPSNGKSRRHGLSPVSPPVFPTPMVLQ